MYVVKFDIFFKFVYILIFPVNTYLNNQQRLLKIWNRHADQVQIAKDTPFLDSIYNIL